MIAIIDYQAGNICSVENALARLGCEYTLTADPAVIRAAEKVILPGVGNDAAAMRSLSERGLVSVIRSLRRPIRRHHDCLKVARQYEQLYTSGL